MNFNKKRKLLSLIIVLVCVFLSSNIINVFKIRSYSNKDNLNNDSEFKPFENYKNANPLDPKTEVIGYIDNRRGKIFCNISTTNKDSYVNRYQPGLNNQPNLFLQNWNLTHASMVFENITALNYTKNIEIEPTEFIISYSETDPIYVYQKFSVETNQYVNNVSIFIQDIINEDFYSDENSWEVSIVNCSSDAIGTPNSNETLGKLIKPHPSDIAAHWELFDFKNSWEVSIVNCSNDLLGTPNSDKTLGTLKRPHPIDLVAHWEVFDFKNSEIGSIFLNISKTNSTFANGIEKFWFAIKIKIPPNDWRTGGGPKFLYLNPDGSEPEDIGEGETFAQSPQFINLTSNANNVKDYLIANGTPLKGSINSFRNFDNDRFLVNSTIEDEMQKILFFIQIEVDNLTNSVYSWEDLKNIRKNEPYEWRNILNSIIFDINFSIVTNVSDSNLIQYNLLMWLNPDRGTLDPIYPDQIKITHEYEFLQSYTAIEPEEKLEVIQHMNTSANGNNSIIFLFYYQGVPFDPSDYKASINLFNIKIGEIKTVKTIQKYDPTVHELHYTNNVTLLNSTFNTPNNEVIESVKENDDKFLEVVGDSGSNETIIEFKFNILTDFDSSLWDVDDPIDWIFQLPNPKIYQIDFRISSNVSIQDPSNLTHAALEIYNGGEFAPFSGIGWFQFSDNKFFADINENTKILPFDSFYSWYVMHLINESDNNSLRVRLRFIGNGTFTRINVSIDEFSLNFHIQNVISSDITSKIGFGLNSKSLKPSDIHLKNFGIPILDNGIWEKDIYDGIPTQGFYYFNVTSIWPEVLFDVRGIYTIEKSQNFNWDYILDYNIPKILWNVSSDILYYAYYSNIQGSQGLKFKIPSDWLLMEIYNCSISPPNPNGGWYSTIQSIDNFKIITLYNISDGIWKIGMNSSMSIIYMNYSVAGEIKIDQIMVANATILNHYGGEVNFEVYDEAFTMIYSDYNILNEATFENSTIFKWKVLDTTLTTGTYNLKTYWVRYNQTHAFLSIDVKQINVSKWNSNFTYEPLPETIRFGQEISLNLDFSCENNSISFEGFPVKFIIEYETISQSFTRYIDAYYETSLNYSIPDNFNGNLNITIKFDGNYRISESFEILSLDITNKLEVNIEFIETTSNQYLTGTHYFSVNVTDELGTPLESVEIIFKLLDAQNDAVYEVSTRSNEEGIATASLVFQDLGSEFSILVIFIEKGIYAGVEVSSETFRIIDEFTLFMDQFIQYLPYIIIAIAVISAFITARHFIKSKQRRIWAKEAEILDDLINISYILIIHKDVGVSIYNKQISMELADSDLISGFLQAISEFRKELVKKPTGPSKGFEMDYYDFKIVITDGNYARVALILESSPSDQLKENQSAFTNEFELKFHSYLEQFDGDLSPFKDTDSLIEKYFNISLMYPLQLTGYRDMFKLKSLEKSLIEVAEQIQKEKKFFFISNLLSFGLAGRKESRDQIISTIISLKNKGILKPVDVK